MRKFFIGLIMLFVTSTVLGAEPVSKSYFGSVAIGGVDTTSYHLVKVREQHQEMLGDSNYTVEWNGADWHFASQKSADKFSSDPQRYKPNYNGFCANALSIGEGLVKTDGSTWEFFDEQLYLFYAEAGRQRWLKGNWTSYKYQADNAWLKLTK